MALDVSLSTVQREAARYSQHRSLIVAKEASLVLTADVPAPSAHRSRIIARCAAQNSGARGSDVRGFQDRR
ncbi:MAG TPA: hypothetical protein VNS61_01275, partial [Caldimonas sp.]|nr:hypothetical protein [Caldimonas sp.]